MQAGSIVIIKDVIGAVQSVNGDTYELLCSDNKVRTIIGEATEVTNPHALALLTYNKLLERIRHE